MMRNIDTIKREMHQTQETERSRLNTMLTEARELILGSSNEKIEKIKDDVYSRIKDLERVSKKRHLIFNIF